MCAVLCLWLSFFYNSNLLVIGSIGEIYRHLDADNILYKNKIQKIKQFLKNKKLPTDLQNRILDYFSHVCFEEEEEE